MSLSEHRFISFDETPIHYATVETPGALRAVVILLHGMGEHGGRYKAFAEYLAGFGLQCYIPDLRGFGKSGGRRAFVRRFSDYHQDLQALHAFVSRNHAGAPLFFFGHSFGGLVASSYLAGAPYAKASGLILSSPLFGIAVPVPLWRHWLGLTLSAVCPGLTQPTRVNPSFLTHDSDILRLYGSDPLIDHRISARLYAELLGTIRQGTAIAGRLREPTLLLQAGDDHLVSKEAALKFYDRLAATDKELEVYDGFYHEILNEQKRHIVYSRIGLWIEKHVLICCQSFPQPLE